jgi:hypothetical protein
MDCWTHELDKASTPEEVLHSANDYLCLWAPRELDSVELGLAELKIESVEDVHRVKRSLLTPLAAVQADTRQGAHLRELASYFWRASSRLQELRAS